MHEAAHAIRAFFAIDLDARTRAAAARVADRLRGAPGGDAVRWVRPETFHVTLRFLGEIARERVDALAGCVGERVAGIRPFRLELGGARAFPSRRRPVALVLDVGPREALGELAAAVERGVVAAGFEPERRAFDAHLTLGRIRAKRYPAVTADVTARGESCAVSEVVLFESELGDTGAHYTAIDRAPLGCAITGTVESSSTIDNPKAGG